MFQRSVSIALKGLLRVPFLPRPPFWLKVSYWALLVHYLS